MRVVRRFHVALKDHPGWVALYSLIEEGGERRLRWDGICGRVRVPVGYKERLPTSGPIRRL